MAQVTWLYCHICRNAQRDRRAYRDHLLRVHGEVIRQGSDTPVRLVGRELEIVWSADYRRQMSGPDRAARCREALGLPRVSNKEATRCLIDNRARSARRFRAAARARAGTPAPVTAPDVPATPAVPVLLIGRTPANPTTASSPPGRTYSPCARCLDCPCRGSQRILLRHRPRPLSGTPPAHAPPLHDEVHSDPLAPLPRNPPSCGMRPSRLRGPLTCPLGMRPRLRLARARRP